MGNQDTSRLMFHLFLNESVDQARILRSIGLDALIVRCFAYERMSLDGHGQHLSLVHLAQELRIGHPLQTGLRLLEHIKKHDHRQDDNRPQHQVATELIQRCLRYDFSAPNGAASTGFTPGLERENTTCMRPVSNQTVRGRSGSAQFIEYNILCKLGNGPRPGGPFLRMRLPVRFGARAASCGYGVFHLWFRCHYGGETCRHRCGARSSKPVVGRNVHGRFDPYTSPPNATRLRSFNCRQPNPLKFSSGDFYDKSHWGVMPAPDATGQSNEPEKNLPFIQDNFTRRHGISPA